MNITQLVTGPLGVNTWCIPFDTQRMMIVDPGGNADSIIAHLQEHQMTGGMIFLTHGHFDHLMAVPELVRAFPGIPIAIHPDDAGFLGDGAMERHLSLFTAIGGEALVRQYREILPPATLLLEADTEIIPGWRVLHTPGHSPGSVCLYDAAEHTLIAGDTLFNAGFGRTDIPGGDFEELKKSIGILSRLPPDTVVLPGHGARTTIGNELGH